MLWLNLFEYQHAVDSFKEAEHLDPDFAMAAWGEAMTHTHPVWSQDDRGGVQAAMAKRHNWADAVAMCVVGGRLALGVLARSPGQPQTCACRMRGLDISGQHLAILEADHSPSPLLKIAATFFESTNNAAVSASAATALARHLSSSAG